MPPQFPQHLGFPDLLPECAQESDDIIPGQTEMLRQQEAGSGRGLPFRGVRRRRWGRRGLFTAPAMMGKGLLGRLGWRWRRR
ncbi:MAG: hypothetical protein ACP5NB_13445, partial [Chloroflexia bacterium]